MDDLKNKMEQCSKSVDALDEDMRVIFDKMGFEKYSTAELRHYFEQKAISIGISSTSYATVFLTGMMYEKERFGEDMANFISSIEGEQ